MMACKEPCYIIKGVFPLNNYKKEFALLLSAAVMLSVLTGCGSQQFSGNTVGSSLPVLNNEQENSDADASPSSQVDTSITTADTSGMEFSFDKSDTVAAVPETGKTVEVTEETPKTTSTGEQTYNITAGGTYTLSGTITDTMLTVDANNADVNIILNGVTIQNSQGPAIYVREADKVTITLAEGTTNTLSDGSSYSITDSDSTLDATIFSKADLTINGSGTMVLNGNYKHAIVSKDDLIISSGTLKVTSNKVGLNGKDCVKINSGNITIDSGSDGIRSDNDEDTSKGYVYLYGGTINITAGNDGIQAETVVNVEEVDLTVKAGGGSTASLTTSDESYKGIKAGSDIYISGGKFNVNSLDDCIHSNGTITISGGSYTLSSGDDGVHADTDLAVSGSSTKLSITKSYEGIEATNLVISGGDISIVASDDGLNAAGGTDSSGMGGRPGKGSFSGSTGKIVITGGTLTIKANGDGLDANGTLSITGGTITVIGPIRGDTAILDFDSTGTISGGTFIGVGASSMAQNFSASSTQGAIMVNTGTQEAGTLVQLKDHSGTVLIRYTAEQSFACVILSHPSIVQGGTYTLSVGSSSTEITMTATVYGGSGGMGGHGGGGMMPGGNAGVRPDGNAGMRPGGDMGMAPRGTDGNFGGKGNRDGNMNGIAERL